METLAAIYVVLTSLFGTAVIVLLASLYAIGIWHDVMERQKINKMDKSFTDSNRS